MILTLTPDLEQALEEYSHLKGTTPENFIVSILRQIVSVRPELSSRRQAALTAIRNGKYARSFKAGELLPSEIFAASKQEEKEREERRRTL